MKFGRLRAELGMRLPHHHHSSYVYMQPFDNNSSASLLLQGAERDCSQTTAQTFPPVVADSASEAVDHRSRLPVGLCQADHEKSRRCHHAIHRWNTAPGKADCHCMAAASRRLIGTRVMEPRQPIMPALSATPWRLTPVDEDTKLAANSAGQAASAGKAGKNLNRLEHVEPDEGCTGSSLEHPRMGVVWLGLL